MSTIIQVSVVSDNRHSKGCLTAPAKGEGVGLVKAVVTDPHQRRYSPQVLPKRLDLSDSDNALVAVYCFIKNFIGASAGTSTVAIDNKIEQAMDLVKSHLMFAVREEVDVLKEKITELMDRISQLEVENGILKANASQETLSQLPPSQVNTQNSQNNQTGQPQTVPSSGQLIRPPNANQNQTQTNQQTTNS